MADIDIRKPTLVVNRARVKSNILKMVEKARKNNVRFRPHFKTHQSSRVGDMFKKEGVRAITVSNVDMAGYFVQHGWKDVTIAFPVNIRQIEEINGLAQKVTLNLLVESVETVRFLQDRLKSEVNIWIKIDSGYRRAGISADDFHLQHEVVNAVAHSNRLRLKGLLTHAGHSYHADGKDELTQIYNDTSAKLNKVKSFLHDKGISGLELSVGDTPTISRVDDLGGVDEIRPGNFVFYDVMQLHLGSCEEENIAVAAACPIVALHPKRNEVIIYGGAVHLSKESLRLRNGTKIFGLLALGSKDGWGPALKNTFISSISQEHGIVKTDKSNFDKFTIGDLVYVLPVHSCLTANLLKDYHF